MLKTQFENRRHHRGSTLLFALSMLVVQVNVIPVYSQASRQNAGERKVIAHTEPEYPQTLRRIYIGGIVRVEVQIAPSGVVEKITLLGGNPVLGQSAMKAVKQWRYAPAKSTETLTVTFDFDPHV